MALIKTRRVPLRGSAFPYPAVPSFGAFDDMENRMRKMFDGTLSPFDPELFAQPVGFLPATEVVELDDKLVVTTELPGLDKADVDIAVDEGVLTIRGEKAEEKKEDEGKKYHLYERTYGSFQRSFTLPRTVDPAAITAEFEKGVLKVFLPKTAEVKPKGRKIEIGVK